MLIIAAWGIHSTGFRVIISLGTPRREYEEVSAIDMVSLDTGCERYPGPPEEVKVLQERLQGITGRLLVLSVSLGSQYLCQVFQC